MRIKEYNLKIGTNQIYGPITKILSVQSVEDKIKLWVEVGKRYHNNYFLFFIVENDVNLKDIPYFEHAKYLNTVIVKGKPLHVYFFQQAGKAFLERDKDK